MRLSIRWLYELTDKRSSAAFSYLFTVLVVFVVSELDASLQTCRRKRSVLDFGGQAERLPHAPAARQRMLDGANQVRYPR